MNHSLEQQVAHFIKKHWDQQSKILLAFSGGPDSLALLHLLLSLRKNASFFLALAHVDHGWRKEGQEEALQIAEMAKHLGLTLHTKKLDPNEMEGNLEAACREARLKFFSDLCQTHHYQAVLMAHHADDLAETVLKRVLEGSSMTNLSGISPLVELYGMNIWRPLLSIPKHKLTQWLKDHSLKGFDDHTNRDPRFLRARLRTKIIPQLSEDFGKEISSGLCRVGIDSFELREYLDEKISPYLDRIIVGDFGVLLDLSRDCPSAAIEIKHLIRSCCERYDALWTRENIEVAAQMLIEGSADKQLAMGKRQMYIDRGRLFIVKNEPCKLPLESLPMMPGQWKYGPWQVEVSLTKMFSDVCSNWRLLWQGKGEVVLPAGNYDLGLPCLNALYPRSSPLSKWWTNHKVPAFFRMCVPVVYREGLVRHEFLTGKRVKVSGGAQEYIKINFVKSPVNC